MKPSRSFIAVVLLGLAFLFSFAPSLATASSKAKPRPPIDTRILIKSVDARTYTVVFQFMRDKDTEKEYAIDDLTSISYGAGPGTFAGIRPGMQVRSYVERDGHTLDAISVSVADPAPVAPKSK